jgi:uncharacterized membrane protein
VKQKAEHAAREAKGVVGVATRDLANRSRGMVAHLRTALRAEQADDDVVVERARARLGRLSAHPSAIEVHCQEGHLRVGGPILAEEADRVLRGLAEVRGVRDVVSGLELHSSPDVPPLQGGEAQVGPLPELLQERWSPAFRAAAGLAGLALLAAGRGRRGLAGVGAGIFGIALATRAITNRGVRSGLGLGRAGRAVRGIDVRKSIHVAAPVEEVFGFFGTFENFPRFMSHVREVRPAGEGLWHWTVRGPANLPVEWDARITDLVASQVIAWQSVAGSQVETSGVVRFEPEAGGTRMDVRMSYSPPAGLLGHAVASLLGKDPKKQLDDDLLRLKSLLEKGKATGREGKVDREALRAGPVPGEPPR